MNIQDIEESIRELEDSQTTFSNAFKLASLYILKEHLKPTLKPTEDNVERELSDILPQYKRYIEVKREFQLGEVNETKVLEVLGYLGQEIKEFLQILYASTSSPEERKILINIYTTLNWSP